MRTDRSPRQRGVTLIELVVFIVVLGIALTAVVTAMNNSLIASYDPVSQMRALECAQATLDQISARKFDENSSTGGVPACGSADVGAVACLGIAAEAQLDDVGDFAGYADTTNPDCSISVTVVNDGTSLGLANDQARLVTVDVTSPGGGRATLAIYRTNF